LAIVLAIAVPATALPFYLLLGSPDYPDQPLAARGTEVENAREIERLTRELEAKLKSGKGDATGWMMLARIKTRFGDFTAATEAYMQAAATLKAAGQPVPADLHVAIGEAHVAKAQGQITPRAVEAFRAALAADPKHPLARFYLAVAKQTGGDTKGALEDFKALLADAPSGAPYRAMLEERIRRLDDQSAPPPK
jgi:cytochrome c-type biogenesis protein CcmH